MDRSQHEHIQTSLFDVDLLVVMKTCLLEKNMVGEQWLQYGYLSKGAFLVRDVGSIVEVRGTRGLRDNPTGFITSGSKTKHFA